MNLNQPEPHRNEHQSLNSEKDIYKLINICNSYGLNQDETAQLIEEFKRGALFTSNQSYSDSLNQTLNEITFIDNNQAEEYSFKHQNEQNPHIDKKRGQDEWIYMEQNLKSKEGEEPTRSIQGVQKLIQEKMTIERDLFLNLQEENNRLRSSLERKDQKIEELLEMKRQDTQIIVGLKDIIANLTNTLQQKELSYREIQEKYNNLIQSKIKELRSNKSSTDIEQYPIQDISNNYIQHSRSSSRVQKEVPQSKQSREYTEGSEAMHSGKSSCGEANMRKSKQSSRIDIRKYKQMIQNMRNNH